MLFFDLGVILYVTLWYILLAVNVKAAITKIKADMSSVATSIECYYKENGKYPGYQVRSDGSPTFLTVLTPGNGEALMTTPIDCLTSLPTDFFRPEDCENFPDKLYAFKSDPEGGWILGSRGPDGDWDIDYINAYDLSKGEEACPGNPDYLYTWTYDPTNGTWSSGDIWRVKK
jgi:hypothetical protein